MLACRGEAVLVAALRISLALQSEATTATDALLARPWVHVFLFRDDFILCCCGQAIKSLGETVCPLTVSVCGQQKQENQGCHDCKDRRRATGCHDACVV